MGGVGGGHVCRGEAGHVSCSCPHTAAYTVAACVPDSASLPLLPPSPGRGVGPHPPTHPPNPCSVPPGTRRALHLFTPFDPHPHPHPPLQCTMAPGTRHALSSSAVRRWSSCCARSASPTSCTATTGPRLMWPRPTGQVRAGKAGGLAKELLLGEQVRLRPALPQTRAHTRAQTRAYHVHRVPPIRAMAAACGVHHPQPGLWGGQDWGGGLLQPALHHSQPHLCLGGEAWVGAGVLDFGGGGQLCSCRFGWHASEGRPCASRTSPLPHTHRLAATLPSPPMWAS